MAAPFGPSSSKVKLDAHELMEGSEPVLASIRRIREANTSESAPNDPKGKGKGKEEGGNASIKGFIGGTASGLTKLIVGHPFDTLKIRMQCSPAGTYKGLGDCVMQLIRKEGILSVYKGATPPAVGWSLTDAVLLGSLHNYRLFWSRVTETGQGTGKALPTHFHALSGAMAGWTNSLFTTPVELIKSKLQMQHQRVSFHVPGAGGAASAGAAAIEYTGPINCVKQIVQHSGVKGLWHALPANLLFRSNFAVMFGCYDYIHRSLVSFRGNHFPMSDGLCTFLAGGLAAELYWLCAFPADVIKNRMMADSLRKPEYPTIRSAFLSVWNAAGPNANVFRRVRRVYTGFLPCLLRAFPTNAAALFAFETTMKLLGAEDTANH